MSNNPSSQPFSTLNQQNFQQQPISSMLETSIPRTIMMPVGPVSNSDALQQVPSTNEHMRVVEPISYNHGSQKLPMTTMHAGRIAPKVNDSKTLQSVMPNKGLVEMQSMHMIPQSISENKHKASMESISSNYAGQHVALPNRRVMQVDHRPWMQQLSSPSMKSVQNHPTPNSPRQQHMPSLSNKVVFMESLPKKAVPQQLLIPKNQTAPTKPSPKVQADSLGSVRSKLIESLTGALALVTQQQESPSGLKNNAIEPATSLEKNKELLSSTETSSITAAEVPNPILEKTSETVPSSDGFSALNLCNASQTTLNSENTGDSPHTWKYDGPEFQLNPVMPEIDVPFGDNMFVKDDFLQGNGLSWAMDVDMEMEEKNEAKTDDKQSLGVVEAPKEPETPEIVASKIETELFKLYGGVNKKYKEKGRSLLFNLKDRNNPELRERVMSGDILPERLCSMTAEELASKELSEWRIAKAEELAQMIVLPDSDVDMRRLVKKTHKGDIQVEFEQDDIVSGEVSAGTSSLPLIRPRSNKKARLTSGSDKTKEDMKGTRENSQLDQKGDYTLTILPNEDADLMLDEFKDADFLPPIVSLDEFMESLDSEPPFQNIPEGTEKKASLSDIARLETGSELKSRDSSLKEPLNSSSDKPDEMDVKASMSVAESKLIYSPIHSATVPDGASKAERIWEGSVQLTPSASIAVIGFFKSGEKISAKEWSRPIEIKGRVRLEAFEKFIHDLPMSRSRAIMIIHFVMKEGSSESDLASLSEVTDSYLMEDRVGYAEPCSGVELYVCPTHLKTLEMFKKHLPKDHIQAFDGVCSNNNGLIGVVIWRKSVPQTHHHHRHHSSKRSKPSAPAPVVNFRNMTRNNDGGGGGVDDDDLPPGFEFGPGSVKDDDDLPEFNFSGNSNISVNRGSIRVNHNSQNKSKPVNQMRELIQKYGQSDSNTKVDYGGVAIQPWKHDDDDDDMPEWRPQSVHQLNPTIQPPVQSYHQQALRPHTVTPPISGVAISHQNMAFQSHPPPTAPLQRPQNGAWGATQPRFGSPAYPSTGQSGTDLRRNAHRG